MLLTSADVLGMAMANPINASILERLPQLGVKQCYLTAGCIFQAVWNARAGRPADWGIKDYDVFYFDDGDLSWEAEDRVIRRAEALFADLGVAVEVRNQARVHLWFQDHFGYAYPKLASATEGIDRYLICCTCLGIEASTGALYARYGLDDLWEGRLVPNPVLCELDAFAAKAQSYLARWPWLEIVPGVKAAG